MFMHGGLLHLGGNMLFLWIFGNNVEDAMGPVKFLLFYLLGGRRRARAAGRDRPELAVPTLGASGAIAAVLGGYILLFPRARVVTVIFIVFFFTILELPAMLVLGIWFLQQALFGYFDLAQPVRRGGGVAYFAHIGGFVFGLPRCGSSRAATASTSPNGRSSARRSCFAAQLMSQRADTCGRSRRSPAASSRSGCSGLRRARGRRPRRLRG